MKILHVIQRYWPYAGGSERHFQEISERLVRAGHEVTVFTTDAFELERFWNPTKARIGEHREHHNGVEIIRFPVRHLVGRHLAFGGVRRLMLTLANTPASTAPLQNWLARFVPWVPALGRALGQADDFDLVNGMNICFESLLLPAQALARRRGIPFIITPLIHLGEGAASLVRRYYTMPHQLRLIADADAVLAQTTIERDFLTARGVRPERIHLAGVGVNPDEVLGGDSERGRATLGLRGPGVLYVGTSAYDKGTVHLVEAMRQLWSSDGPGRDAILILAGQRLDSFQAYLDGLPRADQARIRQLGYIEESAKRDLFAAAEVFAMPSRTDSFGIVYLESWLYGKPVIGARAGGVPAIIDDGINGYLVDFGDVGALARRIEGLLAQPEQARQLGQHGRAKVIERYTWDRVFPSIEEVYECLGRQIPVR